MSEGISAKSDNIKIVCLSFGFKYNDMPDANLVFDVRCLKNPFYVEELKELTGLNKAVLDYVMQFEESKILANSILRVVTETANLFGQKGKEKLVVAFGCTGGKHRSVSFAEYTYKMLLESGFTAETLHRDINKR